MTITLSDLKKRAFIETAIIHSIDLALYQASVMIDGEEHYIVDKHGCPVKSHNKLELQALFEKLNVASMRLRHRSAYDEMIGQPARLQDNMLDVPLGNPSLGASNRLEEH